ncbi:hypothetical protein GCM10025876_19980 [Demequina litorisediminis]|uniref:Uncharacterized protein n=1 Tax=Demequina litorisediminis TaxID=1849022 RepID=A0ABQ6IDL0_9MICO|nr:hypothetical protein GCM10025876_19980 [Demequina litorisediminis]
MREQSILRRLVEAGTRIAAMGYDGDGAEIDLVVDGAQAEIFAVTERRNSADYLAIGDIMEATLEQIDAASAHDGSMRGIPTGFKQARRPHGWFAGRPDGRHRGASGDR